MSRLLVVELEREGVKERSMEKLLQEKEKKEEENQGKGRRGEGAQ